MGKDKDGNYNTKGVIISKGGHSVLARKEKVDVSKNCCVFQ